MNGNQCKEIIDLLAADAYLNANGLKSVADDNEWADYKIPKAMQKKIVQVLAANSTGGGFNSNVGTNSGNVNNVQGDNHKFDQRTTNHNAPQSQNFDGAFAGAQFFGG